MCVCNLRLFSIRNYIWIENVCSLRMYVNWECMQFKNVCELRLYAIRKYWLFLYRGSILEGCFRKFCLKCLKTELSSGIVSDQPFLTETVLSFVWTWNSFVFDVYTNFETSLVSVSLPLAVKAFISCFSFLWLTSYPSDSL